MLLMTRQMLIRHLRWYQWLSLRRTFAAAPAAPNVARVAENCNLGGRSHSIRACHCRYTILIDLARNPNLGRNSMDETLGWD